MKKVAFLFGAGASIRAGMPSTDELTELILSGEGFDRNPNDGRYEKTREHWSVPDLNDNCVERVMEFLSRCKSILDAYFMRFDDRSTNYEDLYYVISEVHDDIVSGENPAVHLLTQKLISRMDGLLSSRIPWHDDWQHHELATECMNYIKDMVKEALERKPLRLDHLSCLIDGLADTSVSVNGIFTLNHDRVIELCLRKHGVHYADGFGEQINNVYYWTPSQLDRPGSEVRLIKIHGSVDWFYCFTGGEDRIYRIVKRPLHKSGFPKCDKDGESLILVKNENPMLLIGTRNKTERYGSGGLFFRLQHYFFRILDESDYLVVAGYGFKDTGINARILDWADDDPGRKIIFIAPDPEPIISAWPYSTKLRELERSGRLHAIAKGIEEVSWQDIVGRFE